MPNLDTDIETPVLELAEALINCPSVTPDDANCQTLIADFLKNLGFQCETLRFGDVDNLWARLGNTHPLLVFLGHTDVVPPGPLNQWTSPPFQATLREGVLYGRGASDMKSAIAAMLIAVKRFTRQYPTFPGSIGFLLTSDEEGPSVDGTQKVIAALQNRGEKIDYCIVGEPSSNQHTGDQIRVGRRGSLHGTLTVLGKQGHVANPHLAKNPIHLSALALDELAKTTWDQGNDDFPPTTFQISNLHSGTGAANVIPGHLEARMNFRFSTAVKAEELQARVQSILNKHHFDYHLDWHVSAAPFLTKKGKLLAAAQQAIQAKMGHPAQLSTGGGTSDARFIVPTGAEVIELGVSNATAHQINEGVALADIECLADIYHDTLELLFSRVS